MAKIATIQTKNGSARKSFPQNKVGNETAEIQRLAYQFFVERGYQHGHDQEDWSRAEAIIKNRSKN